MKRKVKKVIKNNMYSLHFDGKRINQAEYQVVCLQSSDHEIKLGALKCEFNAFPNIKMIMTDSTALNTGSKNGVVVKLKELFLSFGLSEL